MKIIDFANSLIRDKILKPFHKTRNQSKDSGKWKTLVHSEKGKSFKGHSCDIHFNADTGKKGDIWVNNNYYSGAVSQKYSIDEHETITTFMLSGYTPKWLNNKIDDIGCRLANGSQVKEFSLRVDDNPMIDISRDFYSIKYDTIINEVAFTDHFENINELKRLTLLYRKTEEQGKIFK